MCVCARFPNAQYNNNVIGEKLTHKFIHLPIPITLHERTWRTDSDANYVLMGKKNRKSIDFLRFVCYKQRVGFVKHHRVPIPCVPSGMDSMSPKKKHCDHAKNVYKI